jgi:Domain of unknown function (DUF892)
MKEFKGSAALDAGLLASAQAVEHYEISRYGTLKTWAEQLGVEEAVNLLGQTLEEEKKTDEALTELAKSASTKRLNRRRSDNGRRLRVRLWDPRDVSSSATSPVNWVTPVIFPPGRLRLVTRPSCTGSLPQ